MALLHLAGLFALLSGFLYSARRPGFDLPALPGFGMHRGTYILQIQVLKVISAFTVNLSYNLEPIYSIIGAMLIFQEAKDLNFSFYLGLGLIVLSVVLQTLNVLSQHRKFIPSLYVKWKR